MPRFAHHKRVEDNYAGRRQPERYDAGEKAIGHVDHEHAQAVGLVQFVDFGSLLGVRVEAGEYGHEREQGTGQPARGDHESHTRRLGRMFALIVERVVVRYAEVSVYGQAAQVKNGRRAEEHVAREPHATHERLHVPAAGEQLQRVERHDEQSHRAVGDGQRAEECVRRRAQIAVPAHGHHHEDVARHGQHYDGKYEEAEEHLVQRVITFNDVW